MTKVRLLLKVFLLLCLSSLGAKTPVIRELSSVAAPPLVDPNGVNLASGRYAGVVEDIPADSPRIPGLQRFFDPSTGLWRFNHTASLNIIEEGKTTTRIQVSHPLGLVVEYEEAEGHLYHAVRLAANPQNQPFVQERLNLFTLRFNPSNQAFLETLPSGEQRTFTPHFTGYFLKEASPPDGYHLNYHYDEQGRLHKIETLTPFRDRQTGWIQFHYHSPHSDDCIVTSSEGHHLAYEYLKPDFGAPSSSPENRRLLRQVRSQGKGAITYEYAEAQGQSLTLLTAIVDESQSAQRFTYTPDGKIQRLNETIAYHFEPGMAEVTDAHGNVKRYSLSPKNHLQSIQLFLPGRQLYRQFNYQWGKALISKRLLDGSGLLLAEHCFKYDDEGRLKQSTLKGNLTGEPGAWNAFSTKYTYEDAWPHRLKTVAHDNDLETHWTYHDSTSRPTSRLVYMGGELLNRQFFSYDHFGNLISTVLDDGQAENRQDLTGVTHLQMTSIQPRLKAPGFGLPEEIQEGYLDPDTHHVAQLKRTLKLYSDDGRLEEEQVLDGMDQLVGSVGYHYDDLGRLTDTQQGEARRVMTYDEVGRVSLVTNDRADGYIRFEYDPENRLAYQEKRETTDRYEAQTLEYDVLGRLSSKKDLFANPTNFSYDSLGRITQIHLPEALDAQDQVQNSSRQQTYNLFDLPDSYTDEEGYTTYLQYNLRGQITRISYADGTEETHRYRLDGQEVETVDRSGQRETLEKDALGRTLQRTLSSSEGDLLQQQSFEFSGLKPTQIQDLRGVTHSIKYDAAGRVEEILEDFGTDSFQAQFLYGEAGNLEGTKVWHGYRPRDFTLTSWNPEDQWIAVADSDSNLIQSIPLSTLKNGQNFQILHSEVNYRYYNELGQNVLQTKLVTDEGATIVTTYDALGRENFVEILDPFAHSLRKVEYRYDKRGMRAVERYHANGEIISTRKKAFGPNGRLEWESDNQRTTHYRYDDQGRVEQVIKPDGVSLSTTYDANGRVALLNSSDGTIHYEYLYDSSGQPVGVVDHIHNTTSRKTFDPKGRLTGERLGNDLPIHFVYNRAGQITEITLPDQSLIQYTYAGPQLQSIERLGRTWSPNPSQEAFRETVVNQMEYRSSDPVGEEQATYKFDPLHQLVQENTTSYQYDHIGNPLTTSSATEDVNGNLISKEDALFTYDALNRLIRYERPQEIAATYTYDAWNRRVQKTLWTWSEKKEKWKKTSTLRFLYDHQREIGCVNDQGEIVELRLLGNSQGAEIGAAIAMEVEGQTLIPIHDHRGCVRVLLDKETNQPVETYRYTAFGTETLYDSQGQELSQGLSPWRFSSKRVDEESGLVFFGQRYYDPALSRWITPDPLGTFDGPSPYTYVRNNPIFLNDAFGLFSITESLQSAVATGANLAWDLVTGIITLSEKIGEKIAIIDRIGQELEDLAQQLIGDTLFYLSGYYVEEHSVGCVGTGELNDRVRITYINGMLNNLDRCLDAAQLISETHGNLNVHFLHSASGGYTWDVLHAVLRKGGYTLSQARLLADLWRDMINEMGGPENGGTIYHYAHSIGGTDTLLAKEFLSPEERAMIHVVTLGSASLIPEDGFGSVLNLVSYRDGVPYFDPQGYLKGILNLQPNVHFIGDLIGIPFVDHCIRGPSYREALDSLGSDFLQFYGML